jgi:hypothetical protein
VICAPRCVFPFCVLLFTPEPVLHGVGRFGDDRRSTAEPGSAESSSGGRCLGTGDRPAGSCAADGSVRGGGMTGAGGARGVPGAYGSSPVQGEPSASRRACVAAALVGGMDKPQRGQPPTGPAPCRRNAVTGFVACRGPSPVNGAVREDSDAVSTPATATSSHLDHAPGRAASGALFRSPGRVPREILRPWLRRPRWESCCTSAAGGRHSRSLKG